MGLVTGDTETYANIMKAFMVTATGETHMVRVEAVDPYFLTPGVDKTELFGGYYVETSYLVYAIFYFFMLFGAIMFLMVYNLMKMFDLDEDLIMSANGC